MQLLTTRSGHELLARRMKALGHPVRIAIMDTIRRQPECVCHLECALRRPQPYLSQQLRVLRESGLIADERDGTNVFYRVADEEVAAWLAGVMGPVTILPADSKRHAEDAADVCTQVSTGRRTETGTLLPDGRIDGCPCPKCSAARDACSCADATAVGTSRRGGSE